MSSAFSTGFPHARHCSNSSSLESLLDSGSSSSTSARPRPAPPPSSIPSIALPLGLRGAPAARGRSGGDRDAPSSERSEDSAPSTGGSSRAPGGMAAAAERRCSRMPSAAWPVTARATASISALLSEPSAFPPPGQWSHSRLTARASARAPRSASERPEATSAGKSRRSNGTRSGLVAPGGAAFRATRTMALTKRTTAVSELAKCSPWMVSRRTSRRPNLSWMASCHKSTPSLGIISEGSRPSRRSDS
mmetsp:Transcript_16384/g.46759  ORF Transcript_16384/g.46759 Transcript_16384/m.46759 type:complete len:248 (-) Transcript_16384:168-911(-)